MRESWPNLGYTAPVSSRVKQQQQPQQEGEDGAQRMPHSFRNENFCTFPTALLRQQQQNQHEGVARRSRACGHILLLYYFVAASFLHYRGNFSAILGTTYGAKSEFRDPNPIDLLVPTSYYTEGGSRRPCEKFRLGSSCCCCCPAYRGKLQQQQQRGSSNFLSTQNLFN